MLGKPHVSAENNILIIQFLTSNHGTGSTLDFADFTITHNSVLASLNTFKVNMGAVSSTNTKHSADIGPKSLDVQPAVSQHWVRVCPISAIIS